MRKFFEIGGLVAAAVLIVFGAVAITMGVSGRHTVDKSPSNEFIVGTPDMTPSAIKAEAVKAGIASSVKEWPTQSVASHTAKPGTPKARLMPGGGTDNATYAAIDPKTKAPVQNSARQIWVTETALTTALNTSYMASQLGLFGIVVGVALL